MSYSEALFSGFQAVKCTPQPLVERLAEPRAASAWALFCPLLSVRVGAEIPAYVGTYTDRMLRKNQEEPCSRGVRSARSAATCSIYA
jgi:hypothetical protein